METLLNHAVYLLPGFYLALLIAYGLAFFRGNALADRLSSPALRLGLVLHFAYLALLYQHTKQFPATGLDQALSLIAFAVLLVYALVEWLGKERSTGFWMVSLVFLFQLFSSILYQPHDPEVADLEIFSGPLFGIHVALAVLGYAAFAVAAGYGFLFMALYRELKGERLSTFFGKLPSLEVLERMMSASLWVGFVSLTGAVVIGSVWAQKLYPETWLHDPKFLSAAATWVLYGVALLLRYRNHWQGRQTAIASLAGLGALLFSLFAVNLLFTNFHAFR